MWLTQLIQKRRIKSSIKQTAAKEKRKNRKKNEEITAKGRRSSDSQLHLGNPLAGSRRNTLIFANFAFHSKPSIRNPFQ